jgi:hypothetical protein
MDKGTMSCRIRITTRGAWEAWEESSGPDKALGWIGKCLESGKQDQTWSQNFGRARKLWVLKVKAKWSGEQGSGR